MKQFATDTPSKIGVPAQKSQYHSVSQISPEGELTSISSQSQVSMSGEPDDAQASTSNSSSEYKNPLDNVTSLMKGLSSSSNVSFSLVEKGDMDPATLKKLKGIFSYMSKRNHTLKGFKSWYNNRSMERNKF